MIIQLRDILAKILRRNIRQLQFAHVYEHRDEYSNRRPRDLPLCRISTQRF